MCVHLCDDAMVMTPTVCVTTWCMVSLPVVASRQTFEAELSCAPPPSPVFPSHPLAFGACVGQDPSVFGRSPAVRQ